MRPTQRLTLSLGLFLVCVAVGYLFFAQLDKCEWKLEFGVSWPGTALPAAERPHVMGMARLWGTLTGIDATAAGLILAYSIRCIWLARARPVLRGFEIVSHPSEPEPGKAASTSAAGRSFP